MIKINTRFGTLFIENVERCAERDGKVRLFDSEDRYLNYIETEALLNEALVKQITVEAALKDYIKEIELCETLDALLDMVIEDEYEFYSDNWEEAARYLDPTCTDQYLVKENLLDNEWVNKIGDYYIVIAE